VILRGTNINPSMKQSPLEVAAKKSEEFILHREKVQEQYDKYRKYLQTDAGKVVSALTDPKIAQCDYLLSQTAVELGMGTEEAKQFQDTVRGERRVWLRIKCEPDKLAKELTELDKILGEPEEPKGWQVIKKSSDKDLDSVGRSPV